METLRGRQPDAAVPASHHRYFAFQLLHNPFFRSLKQRAFPPAVLAAVPMISIVG
jgi:hypothetical protein